MTTFPWEGSFQNLIFELFVQIDSQRRLYLPSSFNFRKTELCCLSVEPPWPKTLLLQSGPVVCFDFVSLIWQFQRTWTIRAKARDLCIHDTRDTARPYSSTLHKSTDRHGNYPHQTWPARTPSMSLLWSKATRSNVEMLKFSFMTFFA